MMKPPFILFVSLLTLIYIHETVGYMKICYYTNWAQYRWAAKYLPEEIPPHLCTHIFYAFGKLTNNDLKAFEWNDDDTAWSEGMFSRVNALKTQNPNLKVLLSIGGWISDDEPTRTAEFRSTANSATNRAIFIQNAIQFLRDRSFDGLDIDWEYPRSTDQHLQLMQELRSAFDLEGQQTNRQRLLLAAAVWGNAEKSPGRYEMGQLGNYMDIVGIMSYDYYGSWDSSVKQHSILYPETDDAVNLWLSAGFPAHKLVTGIATYGRSFTLADTAQTSPGSPANGAGQSGQITNEAGSLAYYEICTNVNQNGWTEVWHSENMVPYAYKGNQWVGFDNVRSIKLKANYVIDKGLGGAMVWDLDLDDFQNKCGNGKYPLINALFNTFDNDGVAPNPDDTTTSHSPPTATTTSTTTTSTTTTSTTTTATTTTPSTGNGGNQGGSSRVDCTVDPPGKYPIPGQCDIFAVCVHSAEYSFPCPPGTLYDPTRQVCNWPADVYAVRDDC